MPGATLTRAAAILEIAVAFAFASPAAAIEPDALPAAIWWQERERGLAEDPLRGLERLSGFRIDGEWAPLYVGADGSRFERERRSVRIATPAARWRGAVELGATRTIARGGTEPAWLGAESKHSVSRSLAIARHARRLDLAGSVSESDGRAGWAFAGRANVGRARWSVAGSMRPRQGHTRVQWEEIDVTATGRWSDQRLGWDLELAPAGALEIHLGQHALDRRAEGQAASAGDGVEPTLAWRTSRLEASVPALGLDWRLAADYGEGHESVRICRDRTAYATIAGPVHNRLVALQAFGPRSRLGVRLWSGGWSGDGSAAVALWPFDGLAAVAGTRRIARSSATLRHRGVAFERLPAIGSGIDGGLALWSLAPHARYETWQATIMGVGRDDLSSGETALHRALVAGARLAGALEWRGARARLELVQWIPIRIDRDRGDRSETPGGGGEPGGTRDPSGGDRGGTIARFTVEASR